MLVSGQKYLGSPTAGLVAGTWPPQKLDNTFGPRAVYQKGCGKDQGENLAPCFGLQFYGHVAIDGATEVMTVTLKDVSGNDLWSVRIEPKLLRWTTGPSAPPTTPNARSAPACRR